MTYLVLLQPLRHCLESIERDGLPCDPARGYSTLKDLLCSTEFVDRKNVATEETSKKEHGRFWTPEVLATLKSRQVKVLLLRLLASSDVRVCICLEDPAMMASSGRKARLLVYNVFLSPHSSDSGESPSIHEPSLSFTPPISLLQLVEQTGNMSHYLSILKGWAL